MEKIINFIKSKTVIDIIFLISLVIIFSICFGSAMNCMFSDRGREFIFPLWITQGLAPYKDFVTIYFPLSYYINALVYKVLGVSVYSLTIFQSFICMLFISFYYLIAREFINRKTAILLTLFVLTSCVFNVLDLFAYIMPYCYGRIHGLTGSIICIYGLIKLFKTDNIKFAYLSAFAAGFAVSSKMEFTSFILFLFIGIILYKRLKIIQYLKIILSFLFFPILTLSLLFISGVRIPDLINAAQFAIKFTSTPAMHYFYYIIGLLPSFHIFLLDAQKYLKGGLEIGIILIFSFLYSYFDKKYLFVIFLIINIAICCLYFNNCPSYHSLNIEYHWDYISFLMFIFALIFCKRIIKDKPVLFLLLGTVFIALREIFKIHLYSQGSFSLPVILLFIVVIIDNYISDYISKEKITKFLNFFFIVLFCVYLIQQYKVKIEYYNPLTTNKGTFYMCTDISLAMDSTMKYIENNIPKNAKMISLPEGIVFYYFLDRKLDNKCFIMDRLYHDAYGEEKALEIIKNTNSDYIMLVKGFDLFDFGFDYLYDKNVSPSADYIFDNYTKIFTEYGGDGYSNISIYKKNSE